MNENVTQAVCRTESGVMKVRHRARGWVVAAGAFALWLLATVALAEATVVVEVRNQDRSPADGTVTLTPASGGRSYSCQTSGGRCQIAGVPGGMHTVTFQPSSGPPSPPRPVMVAPSGNVSLIVNSGR